MLRICPSVRVIVGRVAWKSKNSSGSTWATSSASSASATVARAREAEPAASFQPRKEQTRTGERSCGTSLSQVRKSTRSGYRQGALGQPIGEKQRHAGEAELQHPFGDVVGDRDPDQDSERRQAADHERVAQVDVAVGELAAGADEGDDDDHQQRGRLRLDLREAEEEAQSGNEEDAAADADQAAG